MWILTCEKVGKTASFSQTYAGPSPEFSQPVLNIYYSYSLIITVVKELRLVIGETRTVRLIGDNLEKEGYNIVTESDEEEGLTALNPNTDLIILYIMIFSGWRKFGD